MTDETANEGMSEEKPRRGRPPKSAEEQAEPKRQRKRDRRERIPLGGQRMRLAVEERKGYHRHWFNDEPGRIDLAVENDYEHVLDRNGEKKRELVGTHDGKPLYAYLMEIPEDWYREDQAVKQERIDRIDEQIHRGAVHTDQGLVNSQEFYTPRKTG